MKKTFLICASILLSISVLAQPASNVVNAKLPEGAIKLSRAQISDYARKNFTQSGIPLDKENFYKLDGLIISFWDLSVNPEFKKSLEKTQSELLEILKNDPQNVIDYSHIITVNNIKYLVYQYEKADDVRIWFRSDYNKDNRNICGTIQSKISEKVNANRALIDFLESVRFKE